MLFHLVAAALLLTDSDACDDVLYYFPTLGDAVAQRAEAEGLRVPGRGPVPAHEIAWLRMTSQDVPLCPTLADGDAVRRAKWLVEGQSELGWNFVHYCERMADAESWQAPRWESLRVEARDATLLWDMLNRTLADGVWQANNYAPARRRLALEELKKGLGEERFRAGLMPAPVPFWRFTRIE